MNTHELAWAAGFFDGEGHIRINRYRDPSKSGKTGICLEVAQNDCFVLERFQVAVGGVGYFIGPHKQHKRVYFKVQRWSDIQFVVAQLWGFLSPVKKQQCHDVLQEWKRTKLQK